MFEKDILDGGSNGRPVEVQVQFLECNDPHIVLFESKAKFMKFCKAVLLQ